jgi:beta-mannosidase
MKKNHQFQGKNELSRRQFVKQSALVGGSLVIPGMVSGSFFTSTKPTVKTGIQEHSLLSEGWKIKSFDPETSLNANRLTEITGGSEANGWLNVPSIPAMPHKILLFHKKIEEPWKPKGMEKCYWVSQKDWLYGVNFKVKDRSGEQRLLFKELKGDVVVYLNGELLARHSDQAHPLVLDVTGKLKPENQLALHFVKAAPDEKPGQADPSIRKKNGTYLGPNPMLYTSGVVGEVILERTDGHLIEEIITDFSLNEAFTKGEVRFAISGKSRFRKAKVKVRLLGPDGKEVAESTLTTEVENGVFRLNHVLDVSNPELWWPKAYGDQNLYKAEIILMNSGKVHQKEVRTIGFRKITMPEPFHFVVNGKSVFLRGGDWVTPDLLSEVWDQHRMEGLFAMAEHANFNAFRIWGPVEAPNDRFYEMADERGFLLWQDFTKMPFYGEQGNIPEAQEKARKFLVRLKHHPSILLWCGINEATMWWHEDYNTEFTDKGPWPGLAGSQAVEQVCKELDPDRPYTPSAPYGGVNANEPREGTTNGYTNMWYVPGYDYLNFASEDTRIACPSLQSMEKFMLPEEICPEGYTTLALHGNMNPYPDTWRMFTAAESWKKTGPVEEFYDATDGASLANRVGMAEGVY